MRLVWSMIVNFGVPLCVPWRTNIFLKLNLRVVNTRLLLLFLLSNMLSLYVGHFNHVLLKEHQMEKKQRVEHLWRYLDLHFRN